MTKKRDVWISEKEISEVELDYPEKLRRAREEAKLYAKEYERKFPGEKAHYEATKWGARVRTRYATVVFYAE